MKYLSLFSGIGGFELGIQRAFRGLNVQKVGGRAETSKGVNESWKRLHTIPGEDTLLAYDGGDEHANRSIDEGQPHCIGYSEIDPYADAIYKYNFGGGHEDTVMQEQVQIQRDKSGKGDLPDSESGSEHGKSSIYNGGPTNYGDCTKIDPKELPDFDLLVGGFPCQAFSIAGKRRGFEDIAKCDSCGRTMQKSYGEYHCINTFCKNFKMFTSLKGEDSWHYTRECPKCGYKATEYTHCVHDKVQTPCHKCGERLPYEDGDCNCEFGQDIKIRRLTPTECERLMGYPDDWTKYGLWPKAERSGELEFVNEVVRNGQAYSFKEMSDTRRYKACGNGVVSNVVEEVVRRLYG